MFNNEEQIVRTIESVITQSCPPDEVIVIDDGSRDESANLVKTHFGPSVRLYIQENSGPGLARNRGLSESINDWVAFIDADDIWSEDHLETVAMAVAKIPDCSLVATQHFLVRESERFVWPGRAQPFPMIRNLDFFATKGFSPIQTSAVTVRREALLELGGFANAKLGEDIDCWARMALRYPIAMIERETVAHFECSSSLMGQVSGRVAKDFAQQPIFATLKDAMPEIKDTSRRDSIRSYHTRLLTILLKQALLDADMATAHKLVAEMKKLSFSPTFPLAIILLLGSRVIKSLFAMRSTYKRMRRWHA